MNRHLPFVPTMKIAFVCCIVIGLLSTLTVITSRLAEYETVDPFFPFLFEMTGALTFYMVLPILFVASNRYPITRTNWKKAVLLFTLLTIPVGIIHTLLMWGSRSLLFELLDLGTYDYGKMPYRFAMEYSKQVIYNWMTIGIFQGLAYSRERQIEAKRRMMLESELAQVRLDTLQKQINPHFLFNTLHAISSTMFHDVNKADHMLVTLSDLLRQTMQKQKSSFVSLAEELEFTSRFLELMQARFGEKLRVHINCASELREHLVPFLLLQPLVENALKHGIEQTGDPLELNIAVSENNGYLELAVIDNGPGLVSNPKESQGIGIRNLGERLHQLYGDDHAFSIDDGPDKGVVVHLRIPPQQSPEQMKC